MQESELAKQFPSHTNTTNVEHMASHYYADNHSKRPMISLSQIKDGISNHLTTQQIILDEISSQNDSVMDKYSEDTLRESTEKLPRGERSPPLIGTGDMLSQVSLLEGREMLTPESLHVTKGHMQRQRQRKGQMQEEQLKRQDPKSCDVKHLEQSGGRINLLNPKSVGLLSKASKFLDKGKSALNKGASVWDKGMSALDKSASVLDKGVSTLDKGISALDKTNAILNRENPIMKLTNSSKTGNNLMNKGKNAINKSISAFDKADTLLNSNPLTDVINKSNIGRKFLEKGKSGLNKSKSALSKTDTFLDSINFLTDTQDFNNYLKKDKDSQSLKADQYNADRKALDLPSRDEHQKNRSLSQNNFDQGQNLEKHSDKINIEKKILQKGKSDLNKSRSDLNKNRSDLDKDDTFLDSINFLTDTEDFNNYLEKDIDSQSLKADQYNNDRKALDLPSREEHQKNRSLSQNNFDQGQNLERRSDKSNTEKKFLEKGKSGLNKSRSDLNKADTFLDSINFLTDTQDFNNYLEKDRDSQSLKADQYNADRKAPDLPSREEHQKNRPLPQNNFDQGQNLTKYSDDDSIINNFNKDVPLMKKYDFNETKPNPYRPLKKDFNNQTLYSATQNRHSQKQNKPQQQRQDRDQEKQNKDGRKQDNYSRRQNLDQQRQNGDSHRNEQRQNSDEQRQNMDSRRENMDSRRQNMNEQRQERKRKQQWQQSPKEDDAISSNNLSSSPDKILASYPGKFETDDDKHEISSSNNNIEKNSNVRDFVMSFYKKLEDIIEKEVVSTAKNNTSDYVNDLEYEIDLIKNAYDFSSIERVKSYINLVLSYLYQDYQFVDSILQFDDYYIRIFQPSIKIINSAIIASKNKSPTRLDNYNYPRNVYPILVENSTKLSGGYNFHHSPMTRVSNHQFNDLFNQFIANV